MLGPPLDHHIRRNREYRRLTVFQLSFIMIILLENLRRLSSTTQRMFEEMKSLVRVCMFLLFGLWAGRFGN